MTTEEKERINRVYELIAAYDYLVMCFGEYVPDGEDGPALRKAKAEFRAAKANLKPGDIGPVDEETT